MHHAHWIGAGSIEHAASNGAPPLVQLLEVIPAGAYTCDPEGLITYYNKRAVQVWGREPLLNDPRDRYCGSFRLFSIEGQSLRHDECWMAMALNLRREFNGREIVIERPDGEKATLLAHANPIYDEENRLVGAVNILVDITERREIENALELSRVRLQRLNESLEKKVLERTRELAANQKRLRLLASRVSAAEQRERRRVATDLHANLAQMLAICKMKLAVARKRVDGIDENDEIDGLAEALSDALNYTRALISELSPPLELGENNLPDSVRWVAEKMKTQGLTVHIDDDGAPKQMEGDVLTTIFESVRELLFNVVQHSGTNEATVRLRGSSGHVTIEVVDHGNGFEPATRNQNEGFGLFSIRERLAAFGGRLGIESSPKKGTRAVLTVPVDSVGDGISAPAASPFDGAWQRAHAPGDGSGRIRVLLADDHKIMREGLRKIIQEEQDMTVVAEAENGEDAIKQAAEHHPDIIVMDVGMPKMNGIEATRHILASMPETRIIALSLNETTEAVDAMLEAGASDYLFKTEAVESLCNAIRKHCRKRATA